jgi:thiosulfate/3-mercaptopyruvate sulfurtransferase
MNLGCQGAKPMRGDGWGGRLTRRPSASARAAHVGLAAIVLLLGGCRGPGRGEATTSGEARGADADAGTRENEALLREPSWLEAHLGDPNVVVLHVDQDRRSYDEAHVPGARFLALGAVAVDRDLRAELPSIEQLDAAFEEVGVSDNSRVVLYGGMGGLAATRAFLALDVLGHRDRTALLDGGLELWKSEKRPLSSEAARPSPGRLTPRPVLDRVVDAHWVRVRLDDPSVLLIDVRRPQEFRGEEASGEATRRGHIPGAQNLYWEDFFADRTTRRLHDRATLRAMFERVGARPDRTNVVYCTIGMRASFGYFVSTYAGYDTKMYDGSFVDWSRHEDFPVER